MKAIATAVDRAIEAVLALLMAAMTVVVFAGVVYRYALHAPLGWTEEVGKFLLIWASLLGTYIAVRRAENIRVDAIYDRMGSRACWLCRIATHLLMGAFLVALLVEGFRYAHAFLAQTSPMLEISVGWVYSALPISAALMLVATLANLKHELFHPPGAGNAAGGAP
ncbi:MAG: TRAP transporter small permease [Alphaproteobacteria bacterium]|nr:TRAP transporter small permease [Alphaproteobacteria bacterium]